MFKKIYIEITNICNLKCEFCPETKRTKQYMEVEEFEKIIELAKNKTIYVSGEGEDIQIELLEGNEDS